MHFVLSRFLRLSDSIPWNLIYQCTRAYSLSLSLSIYIYIFPNTFLVYNGWPADLNLLFIRSFASWQNHLYWKEFSICERGRFVNSGAVIKYNNRTSSNIYVYQRISYINVNVQLECYGQRSFVMFSLPRGDAVFVQQPWYWPICTREYSSLSTKKVKYTTYSTPDSKVHGANMGPTWGRQDPGGPHVGPMNLAIWGYRGIISSLNGFRLSIQITFIIVLNWQCSKRKQQLASYQMFPDEKTCYLVFYIFQIFSIWSVRCLYRNIHWPVCYFLRIK